VAKIAVDFYYNRRPMLKNTIHSEIYYGLTFFDENYSEYSCYLSGVEVEDFAEMPGGFIKKTVPAADYIVFRFIGLFHPTELSSRHAPCTAHQEIRIFYHRFLAHFR
jgi:AraC family transcriptional regulator